MMAASGREIRGKGKRAWGRAPAGERGKRERSPSRGPAVGGRGEPRGVRGGSRRRRREEAPRGGRGGGNLAGRWTARGREPAWRACASLEQEREERGRKRRRGRGAGSAARRLVPERRRGSSLGSDRSSPWGGKGGAQALRAPLASEPP